MHSCRKFVLKYLIQYKGHAFSYSNTHKIFNLFLYFLFMKTIDFFRYRFTLLQSLNYNQRIIRALK